MNFQDLRTSLSDPSCKTVKALDNICKTAQGLIMSRQVASKE